jgi:Flp pilus assembly protein TadG
MRRLKRERGAVAVMVAILAIPLIAAAALGVDIAAMAAERQQLQNGADAGALAIAQVCAKATATTPGECVTTAADQIAQDYALTNSNDQEALATVVRPPESLTLSPAAGEVTVENTGVREHWLAPVIGVDASDIRTTATAVWGTTGGGTSLPLTISLCEITKLIGAGDPTFAFNPTSGYYESAAPSGNKVKIKLPHPSSPDQCKPAGASHYVPGGFAWIDPDGLSECSASTQIGDLIGSDTGNNVKCDAPYLKSLVDSGKVLTIPIFDEATGTGGTAKYRVYGYVGFKLTGYGFGGSAAFKYNNTGFCTGTGSDQCIVGIFSNVLVPDGTLTPGAPALGGNTIRLIKK